jgi:predicted lipid-binding transport protein (Tim44 family)
MLTPQLKPYTKPRPERPVRERRVREDDLRDGLWPALFLGLLMGALVCLIVFGLKILIAVGVVAALLGLLGFVARWTIRIW